MGLSERKVEYDVRDGGGVRRTDAVDLGRRQRPLVDADLVHRAVEVMCAVEPLTDERKVKHGAGRSGRNLSTSAASKTAYMGRPMSRTIP